MADANTEVNIQAFHAGIRDAIAAAFPSFVRVEFYRDDETEQLPTPACLLEMVEAEPQPDRDAGTGQWPANLRFEARIIMPRGPTARLNVRLAALSLASWLNLRRIPGHPTDEFQVIACEPDEFEPQLDRFVVWRIEWVVLAFIGESAWKNDGTIPTTVLYGFSPDIGAGNEGKYATASQEAPE